MSLDCPTIQEQVSQCPACGQELEDVYLTDEQTLVYIKEGNLIPIFCTEIGLFMLIPDEEKPYLDHIEFHHTHE